MGISVAAIPQSEIGKYYEPIKILFKILFVSSFPYETHQNLFRCEPMMSQSLTLQPIICSRTPGTHLLKMRFEAF